MRNFAILSELISKQFSRVCINKTHELTLKIRKNTITKVWLFASDVLSFKSSLKVMTCENSAKISIKNRRTPPKNIQSSFDQEKTYHRIHGFS